MTMCACLEVADCPESMVRTGGGSPIERVLRVECRVSCEMGGCSAEAGVVVLAVVGMVATSAVVEGPKWGLQQDPPLVQPS